MTLVWADEPAPAKPKVAPSKEQMRIDAEASRVNNDDAYRHVVAVKEKAAKQKDVIKLTCVNDRLVQLKAQMNIADSARASLLATLDKDGQESTTAYADVTASGDEIRKLREGADACMGETELSKQESGVEVDRPEIPDDPNTIDPYETDPMVSVDPPGYASPYH